MWDVLEEISKRMTLTDNLREYELYMKQVTDSFIEMQSETTSNDFKKDVMTQRLIVEWSGGLEWKKILADETFRDGNLMEENRKYNSEIANKYLFENSLTYDQWFKKYKTSNI